MRRYTTPRILVKISGADLTGCTLYLTFRQGRREVTIKDPDMAVDGTDTYAEVRLSQLQTAKFREDVPVEVEANVVDSNGYRVASDIKEATFGRNLLEVPKHA